MGRSYSPSVSSKRQKERSERKKRRERRSRERELIERGSKLTRKTTRSGDIEREERSKRSRSRSRSREDQRLRSLRRSSRSRSRSREYQSRDQPSTSSTSYHSTSLHHSGGSTRHSSKSQQHQQRTDFSEADFVGKSPEEIEIMKTMGFSNFDTTKNKKVDGNDVGEVHVILKRKYRQYMNRKGGFNRPLDFVA